MYIPLREVSSFQRVYIYTLSTGFNGVGTCVYTSKRGVLISEGVYIYIEYRLQWSWDTEDVSLLERCSHFRGCIYIHCVQASMELGH